MFHRLGKLSASYPWLVCLGWILIGAVLTWFAPPWDTKAQDDDIRFVPDRFTSVRAYNLMRQAFPKEVEASRLVFALERGDQPLTDADLAIVDQMIKQIEELRESRPELKLGKITSYQDGLLGRRLTSEDGQCTLIQVALDTPILALGTLATVERTEESVRAKIGDVLQEEHNEKLKLYATGSAGIGRDMTKSCGDSLESTTVATIILVVVVLLLVYRAPILALIPLLTIAISVWVSLKMLALLTLPPFELQLVNITKIFAVVILYGAGTDYCLFLISRYREELADGFDTVEALARSVGGVGEALTASAGTVMVGLGLMATAEFAKVRYAGPAIALSLGVALIASLTLTPALLRLVGRWVFWPGKPPAPSQTRLQSTRLRPAADHDSGIWDRISRGVARHPLKVWLCSAAVIAPLVYIGLQVKPSYRATGELSPTCESLQGLAAIQRHFTAGEIGPISVLLAGPVDWNGREGRLEIDHLTRGFAALPNVAEVRSLTRPLGKQLPDPQPIDEPENFMQRVYNHFLPVVRDVIEQVRIEARGHFVADLPVEGGGEGDKESNARPVSVTRLDVVLKTDPFDAHSADTLKLIKTWLTMQRGSSTFIDCEVQAECFGITANSFDLAELTESDRQRVNLLVLAAIFGILLLLVRRLWLASYLLVTVLASYYAALGATVLAGYFWTGGILPALDWRVPFFLFTILVAVGEDYNILLVNRALQEQKRFGLIEGMRRALAKTGGAITSCGLIMAGTFATLMLGGLGTLLQIGFALAFGVLVDTFLVRPFLVPAFAIICWKAGAPGPASAAQVPASVPEVTDGSPLVPGVLPDFSQAA